jgi:hypothetical protein
VQAEKIIPGGESHGYLWYYLRRAIDPERRLLKQCGDKEGRKVYLGFELAGGIRRGKE